MLKSVSYYKSQASQQLLIRTDLLVMLNMLERHFRTGKEIKWTFVRM